MKRQKASSMYNKFKIIIIHCTHNAPSRGCALAINTKLFSVNLLLRVYSYFEKGCRKKCTRQSRKVLWVVLSLLLFKEILKEWHERGHRRMFASSKGNEQKEVRQPKCQDQCIDNTPYYLSGSSTKRSPRKAPP